MTRTSQNGWPVLTQEQTAVARVSGGVFRVAPGTERLWQAFVARYVAEVEPITGAVLDDWSWADRNVRGSTSTISNHASATALDLNAEKHPRGVRNTFTPGQVAALRKLLRAFPVIRWGGDFSTVVDEMHVELNATPAEVAAFIKTLEDDVAAADVWDELILRRETDDPDDKAKARDLLGLAVRYGLHASQKVETLTGQVAQLQAQVVELTAVVGRLVPPVTDPVPPVGG